MGSKAWKIIPRPLLETVLNNHAQKHRVPQPLILHGPRGVGKTTIILERLLGEWNKGPHLTGYVDLAQSVKDHHPDHNHSFPWSSWSNCQSPLLANCKTQIETCLESMTHKAIKLGTISSHQIFTTLNKWHGLSTPLRGVLQTNQKNSKAVSGKASTSALWNRALFALSARQNATEIDKLSDFGRGGKSLSSEEVSYYREAIVALGLAKEVIKVHQTWKANATVQLNQSDGFSRTLANSCTDWPLLLLELLSEAAEIGYFQPKLIINNIDVLRNAVQTDDSKVSASVYHDNLIWRIISLCVNERCLPVLFVTSDSYYSYQAYVDYGFPEVFISRETFGWTLQEAKIHMIPDYFSSSELAMIADVFGTHPRHLFELYALKQYKSLINDTVSTFEDILDAYLAFLQVTVVNPAMDRALLIVQKFIVDVRNGKVSEDKLRFGAPWRHPPLKEDSTLCMQWAKIQLIDFVQAFVNTEFGVNYLADYSLEILEDPCAGALLEVGLLYAQRDPSFIRPVSVGIQRCLARWLVQEKMQMSYSNSFRLWWQRFFRGRSYRHLMLGL